MAVTIFKAVLTAAFIVALSELAKRTSFVAALLVALPLATAMTAAWLYIDTRNAIQASDYAWSVLLLVPPGCLFLALLPLGVRLGYGFWPSFTVAMIATGVGYYLYTLLLTKVLGVQL